MAFLNPEQRARRPPQAPQPTGIGAPATAVQAQPAPAPAARPQRPPRAAPASAPAPTFDSKLREVRVEQAKRAQDDLRAAVPSEDFASLIGGVELGVDFPGSESIVQIAEGINTGIADTFGFGAEVLDELFQLVGVEMLKPGTDPTKLFRELGVKLGMFRSTDQIDSFERRVGKETFAAAITLAAIVATGGGAAPELIGAKTATLIPGLSKKATIAVRALQEMAEMIVKSPGLTALTEAGAIPGAVAGRDMFGEIGAIPGAVVGAGALGLTRLGARALTEAVRRFFTETPSRAAISGAGPPDLSQVATKRLAKLEESLETEVTGALAIARKAVNRGDAEFSSMIFVRRMERVRNKARAKSRELYAKVPTDRRVEPVLDPTKGPRQADFTTGLLANLRSMERTARSEQATGDFPYEVVQEVRKKLTRGMAVTGPTGEVTVVRVPKTVPLTLVRALRSSALRAVSEEEAGARAGTVLRKRYIVNLEKVVQQLDDLTRSVLDESEIVALDVANKYFRRLNDLFVRDQRIGPMLAEPFLRPRVVEPEAAADKIMRGPAFVGPLRTKQAEEFAGAAPRASEALSINRRIAAATQKIGEAYQTLVARRPAEEQKIFLTGQEKPITNLARAQIALEDEAGRMTAVLERQIAMGKNVLKRVFGDTDPDKAVQKLLGDPNPPARITEIRAELSDDLIVDTALKNSVLWGMMNRFRFNPIATWEFVDGGQGRRIINALTDSPADARRIEAIFHAAAQIASGNEKTISKGSRKLGLLISRIVGAFAGRRVVGAMGAGATIQVPAFTAQAAKEAMEGLLARLTPDRLLALAMTDPVIEKALFGKIPKTADDLVKWQNRMARAIAILEGARQQGESIGRRIESQRKRPTGPRGVTLESVTP